MKYILIALLLISYSNNAYCQQHEELVTFYKQGAYDTLFSSARAYLAKDDKDASAYEMMGEALFDLGKYDSCILVEQKSLQYDQEKTLISCWAHMYIGRSAYVKGDKKLAKEELNKSISKHATDRMVKYSQLQLRILGLTNDYDSWKTVESEHIIFHFQNTANSFDTKSYVDRREKAYTLINNVFQSSLSKKIDYYVWSSKDDAIKFFGYDVGFTIPFLFVSHVRQEQTAGHQLATTLAYWSWNTPTLKRNRFINAGISVAFDCSTSDKYENARESINKMFVSSVADVWTTPSIYSENIAYPLGGAFIYYLSKNSSIDEFKSIVKDQTIEHARIVYGARFDKMIVDFNTLIGIK